MLVEHRGDFVVSSGSEVAKMQAVVVEIYSVFV